MGHPYFLSLVDGSQFTCKRILLVPLGLIVGGIETGSMYVQYVQGISPNVPARTTFIELYFV